MTSKQVLDDVRALAALVRPSWSEISARIAQSGAPTCEAKEGSTREKLKDIEAKLAEARDRRKGLVADRDEAREKWAGTDDYSTESPEFQAAQEAVKRLGECDDEIASLTQAQIGALRMLGDSTGATHLNGPAPDGGDPRGPMPTGWDSSNLFADEEIRRILSYAATSKSQIGPVNVGEVVSRDAFAASIGFTAASDARRSAWLGVLPQLRRRLRLLDLVPTGTMEANMLPYTVEEGVYTGAAETAEDTTKPEAEVKFKDAEAVAATIAAWMKIQKQSLSDFAALRSIVDARLRYLVERRLENQIMLGAGAGAEIKGMLKVTGLSQVKYTVEEKGNPLDKTLIGITTVLLAEAEADTIIVHPETWEEMLKAKSTYEASAGVKGGSGEYFGGGPFGITAQTIWGLPLIPSVVVPKGEIVVADLDTATQLFIREGVNVLFSDSDQDDFVKNRVTMLGECRAALAVFRPAAICQVWLTKAAEEAK